MFSSGPHSIHFIYQIKKYMIFYCYRPLNVCVCVRFLFLVYLFTWPKYTSPTIFGHEWLIPKIIPMIVKLKVQTFLMTNFHVEMLKFLDKNEKEERVKRKKKVDEANQNK